MKTCFELLSSAWVGVVTHKLRSLLTILGIVVGVAAVIAVISIGKGTEESIISRFEALGSNLVFVSPGARTGFGGVRGAAGSANTLTLEDALAISEQAPYVATVAPYYSTALQLVVGSENMRAQVTGITPEYQQAFNLETTDGLFVSEYDYQRSAKVAVLGANVKDTLFEGADPVGQRMRMGTNIVRVIGVLESKGAGWGSSDDAILIPLSTMQQMVVQPRTNRGERVVTTIALAVSDTAEADYVVDEITSLLRSRHQLGPGVDDDFRITSIKQITTAISESMAIFTFFLTTIACISLLVAGIGVMNIMLVSVLDRTREIGIRKALGAKEWHIWGQFLIEAALLTFAGGIVGVPIGWVVIPILPSMGAMPMTPIITVDAVLLAVLAAVGIGLFFGFYPAWRASRLDPIVALRSE